MTEAPLFLCLDAAPATVDTAKDLPIALFMSEFVSGVRGHCTRSLPTYLPTHPFPNRAPG